MQKEKKSKLTSHNAAQRRKGILGQKRHISGRLDLLEHEMFWSSKLTALTQGVGILPYKTRHFDIVNLARLDTKLIYQLYANIFA